MQPLHRIPELVRVDFRSHRAMSKEAPGAGQDCLAIRFGLSQTIYNRYARQRQAGRTGPGLYNIGCPPVTGTTAPEM